MKRKWIRVLTPLAVAFSMVLALSFPGRAAELVDLNQKCSLTVTPGKYAADTDSYLEQDIQTANIVIDLYQVATVKANTANGYTYDGYQYELLDPYKGLQVDGEMTNAIWREQSQAAAGIALGATVKDGNVVFDGAGTVQPAVREGMAVKTRIESLEPGLYLLIARRNDVGRLDVEQYVTAIGEAEEQTATRVGTIAHSTEYVYTFAPELISLPTKAPILGDVDGAQDEIINTANPGEWIYDATAVLKPQADPRYGSLQITKSLLEYENSGPTTFVFEVVATWKDYSHGDGILGTDGEYRDVVSIDFTKAGTSHVLIEKLPVGAKVTVTEIYSGSSYEPVEEQDRDPFVRETVIGRAEETFEVSFSNRYNGRNTGGHGITNHFRYEAEDGSWIWTSTRADGTDGRTP